MWKKNDVITLLCLFVFFGCLRLCCMEEDISTTTRSKHREKDRGIEIVEITGMLKELSEVDSASSKEYDIEKTEICDKTANVTINFVEEVFAQDVKNLCLAERGKLKLSVTDNQLVMLHILFRESGASKDGPIFHAVQNNQWRMVEILLGVGVHVNATNEQGNSLMHIASERGYFKIVQLLVERGAEIDALNNDHLTPLELATKKGNYEIEHYLTDELARKTTEKMENS